MRRRERSAMRGEIVWKRKNYQRIYTTRKRTRQCNFLNTVLLLATIWLLKQLRRSKCCRNVMSSGISVKRSMRKLKTNNSLESKIIKKTHRSVCCSTGWVALYYSGQLKPKEHKGNWVNWKTFIDWWMLSDRSEGNVLNSYYSTQVKRI